MNTTLSSLLTPLTEDSAYRKIVSMYRAGETSCPVFGMPETAKAPLLLALFEQTQSSMLVVCANDFAAQKLYNALQPALKERAVLLPARTVHLSRQGAQSRQIQGQRAAALCKLAGKEACMVFGGVDAVRAVCVPPKGFAGLTVTLTMGDWTDLGQLAERLTKAGYERTETVEAEGQFALRGGILDVYAVGGEAYRLDFFGDEIESICILDILSQRSMDMVERCVLPPAVEAPLDDRQAFAALQALQKQLKQAEGEPRERLEALFGAIAQGDFSSAYEALPLFMPACTAADYLSPKDILVWEEPARLEERAKDTDTEIAYAVAELAEKGKKPLGWERHLAPFSAVCAPQGVMELPFHTLASKHIAVSFDVRVAQRYQGRMDLLAGDLQQRKRAGYRTTIALHNEKRCDSLYQSLFDRGLECTMMPELTRMAQPGEVVITQAAMGAGFDMADAKYYVLTEHEVFANMRKTSAKTQRRAAAALDLKEGEYAVHDVHGIGIYRGLTTITVEGRPRDFMMLEYKNGDKLYVPAEQMDRVQRYIGKEDHAPQLNKMGGAEWTRAKKKVSQSVKQLAQDLVAIYASRQAMRGHAFAPDSPWQTEFEEAFAFEETEGQEQSIEEIKQDMESPRIMDRLLCGDVGYGKTEVAMRAAFKCVMDAKQVMLLAPTTILAQQHFSTMSARFAGYPIRVDVISRFKSAKEQKKTLEAFANGDLDVLIGTHRLLGKDVRPHDLGLLIIDEEQRFGVGHKETIKDYKRTVDVLTMTATPIPRTLELSLSGIRDMSVIHTPPQDRRPVETFVTEYSPALVREAITRELAREGQAYVLYNSVQTMERFLHELQETVPEARFVMAHGQMTEAQLEKAMMAFYANEADVLLCSTIVESGLDIPSANTMIVVDADRLGLAQLYQLRGRIGRSPRTAYCYMTYQPNKQISETATKRLSAIREFTDLGSGYKIAMRDLEIRGAGNLLGPEQHGHLANVGYDTYCRLLAEAVSEAKGEAPQTERDASVEATVTAHIPDGYIGAREQKVQIYRRIASCAAKQALQDLQKELSERFGEPPQEVQNLLTVALLRICAKDIGAETVTVQPSRAVLRFAADAPIDLADVLRACKAFSGEANLLPGTAPSAQLRVRGASAEEMLKHAVTFAECICTKTDDAV